MLRASFRSILISALLLTVNSPVMAANNYVVRDGNGQFLTKCSIQQLDGSQADCAVDSNNASYMFGPAMTAGTTYAYATYKQRGILFNCTVAGSVDLTDTNGATQTIAVGVGLQYHPFFAIVSWALSSGSSPVCSARALL